jgi:hypothetical protein
LLRLLEASGEVLIRFWDWHKILGEYEKTKKIRKKEEIFISSL